MNVRQTVVRTVATMAWIAFAAFGTTQLSPWAAAWDEVDFVLALDRFDLLAMQPHAPGYPYFVMGGRLMRILTDNPITALGLWNLLLTCSSAWPAYRIARRWLGENASFAAAAIVLTVPMNWALAVRPMSEGAALALLWWYLWTIVRLAEKPSGGRWLAAGFLFGLLMGTRLSYVPFGAALLLVWATAWRRDGKLSFGRQAVRAVWWALSAAGFQLLWLIAVATAEGGFAGTMRLFAGFGEGHFTEWGGGVAQAAMPFSERLWRFALDNWLWSAAFARSVPLAALAGALICIAAWGLWRTGALRRVPWRGAASPAGLLAVCALAYAIWALLGQNIAKPRHAAPLAALSMFALAVWALRTFAIKSLASRAALLTVVLLAGMQTIEGARLVHLQREQKPAVYQLAEWLATEATTDSIIYTWEEERVLRYLNVPAQTRPIYTYDYFLAEVLAERGSRILLTDVVLEAFRRQADVAEWKVRKLAEFRSDDRFDPVYGTISLYEWIR